MKINSPIMSKMYNKQIKSIHLKIYQIKILKYSKTKSSKTIKRRTKVDRIQEKYNFINHKQTTCMLEVDHNFNTFKYQKHLIKNLESSNLLQLTLMLD